MVIEHSFVTTLEQEEALAQANRLLRGRGFNGLALSAALSPSRLELRRGVAKAAKAKTIMDLPQVVRVEFDRGRVSVACAIEPNALFGASNVFGVTLDPGTSLKAHAKMEHHERILVGIAQALEASLVHGVPDEQAVAHWDQVERDADEFCRRKLRRRKVYGLTALFIVFGLLALVICLAIFAG